MTKNQLDGLKGSFELSEKLDEVLRSLTKSDISSVSIRFTDRSDNMVHIMSIKDGEKIVIESSKHGTLSIDEKKRATLAALADMIGTALVSTLKEEHEEVAAKIESWTIEQ